MYENRADHLNNDLILQEISIFIFFQFHCKINRNQSQIAEKNNLWPKSILILSKPEFKILRKRPGDEAYQISFKFPRRR